MSGQNQLGNRLRFLRHKVGATIDQVAEFLGVARSTYHGYESGRRTPDDYETLKKLARYFDVSLDYLLGLEEGTLISDEDFPRVREHPERYGRKKILLEDGIEIYIDAHADLAKEDLDLIRDIVDAQRRRRKKST